MKCQFIDNEEFFEQYILGRIDKPEKQAFEGHLGKCKACTEKLAQEEKILSGIRKVGRAEMKAEIKRQADLATGSAKVNWGAVTRIAALAFILILTPTMYFIYKSEVEPVSAPVSDMADPSTRQKQNLPVDKDRAPSEAKLSEEPAFTPTEEDAVEKMEEAASKPPSNLTEQSRIVETQPPRLSPKGQQKVTRKDEAKGAAQNEMQIVQPASPDLDAARDKLNFKQAEIEEPEDEGLLPQKKATPSSELSPASVATTDIEHSEPAQQPMAKTMSLNRNEIILSETVVLNQRQIRLYFRMQPEAQTKTHDDQAMTWPDEFAVTVSRPDSNRVILDTQLHSFEGLKDNEFSAEATSENEIIIRFGKQAAYRINTGEARTKAIRVEE